MNKRIFWAYFLILASIWTTTFCTQSKTIYMVPFGGYDTATFGTTEDELVFGQLKNAFKKLGYECKYIYKSQIPTLTNEDFKYLILLNYGNTPKEYLEKFDKEKLVLMCFEPELIEPANHDPNVHKLFGKIITTFEKFKGEKYHKFFYWPWVTPDPSREVIPFKERKLATLINGACTQNKHKNELYSQRASVINFFEQQKTTDFEFYGRNWDSKKYTNYRGSIPTFSGKRDILEQYRFCFCFENIKNSPGYISEKILDCLNSGCIPIYWGASNIDQYIPRNCYILREDFNTWQDLYLFIKNMPEEQYQQYINNIKDYVSSDEAILFSNTNFIDSVIKALFTHYDRTKFFNKNEIAKLVKKDTWLPKELMRTKKSHDKKTKTIITTQPINTKNMLWNAIKNIPITINNKFVIVIASYNNKDWVQKNLDSVLMQTYSNYRIIYIDDNSPDGTANLVEQYIKEKNLANRITLIKNTERLGAMANFYNAINLCNENEIIVQLDGDDWFAHENVLNLLNKVYADPNIWLTYGQFEYYPSGQIGFCQQIPDDFIKYNNVRNYKWLASALRTFYAGLFKSIKKEDLLFEGNFVPMAHDVAIMIPMFEMAGIHSQFIPDVLYIYNRTNPINDDKVNHDLQIKVDQFIRSKEKYTPLEKCPLYNKNALWESLKDVQASTNKNFVIVIASFNNKDWVQKNLDSVFIQQYPYYRIIYVDDCSPDGTAKLVEQYLKEKNLTHKVTLIKNTERLGAMANFYNAFSLCKEDEIIVQLDGDDWFPHDYVLDLLNKVYANPDVWLTYGQYEFYPAGGVGGCRQIPNTIIKRNDFRTFRGLASALRTFYTWLFKSIKKEDLLYEGSYVPVAHDMAIMIPMFEMAGFHSQFTPDTLYIYNRATPINDDKINAALQIKIDNFIRAKEKYKPLERSPYNFN